jgi:PAS domain S-box-containing protein
LGTEDGGQTLAAAQPVLDSLRRSSDSRWIVFLFGAFGVAALLFLLSLREPGATALQGLTLLLAMALLVPLHGLRRERRRLNAALYEFSDHLSSGHWQDAVQQLREESTGAPPSALDALASGVEGVLGESDRRWRALADLSADWYWETDAGHRFQSMSGASPLAAILGWTAADLQGRRCDEIALLEPPALGWEDFHRRLDQRVSFRDIECRARARHGEHAVWITISGRPRFDAQGGFVGYEGVGRDITERKTAHEKLAASEQRWSLMAGLASDWYWHTDAQHRMLPPTREFARRFPHMSEQITGRARWEAHADALTPQQWAEHRADLDARRPFRGLQFEADVGGGRLLWLSISGIPRFDGQGNFLGYHGVGRDITVRKHAERLLMRHNEELQQAVTSRTRELEQINRDLEAFSRQLAHEIRTPIGQILGLAQLIEMRAAERLNGGERELLKLQVQSASQMSQTVEALLALARSTVQVMPMERVDLSLVARQAIADLPAIERAAPVDWQIEEGIAVQAAPAPLRIVLSNLLGNAAKFTRHVEQPVVQVRVRPSHGRLCVTVEDNGAGFDPALAGRLFAPFGRLHGGDEFSGTGIGLSIVQRIVERHGGTVSAHGRPGEGARFEFTLAAP